MAEIFLICYLKIGRWIKSINYVNYYNNINSINNDNRNDIKDRFVIVDIVDSICQEPRPYIHIF